MPTHNDETLHDRYTREHLTHLARIATMTPDQIAAMELDLHNALAEVDRLRAQLPRQGSEAVAWREHSVNYAKGEKCPETIETLQAAWDRDQELINDMRHEIARHKTRINRLEQRRPAGQVAEPDAELVELLREARELIEHGDFREGHCMCGSAVEAHGFGDGHSPVDAGVYYAGQVMERIDAKMATLK